MTDHGRSAARESRIRELESEVLRLRREVEYFSVDRITGISGRGVLERDLLAKVARARRQRVGLGFILLDVDHFKRVNDEHGHATGDAVLMTVAQITRSLVRESDTLARYGGEEFVVLVENTTLSDLAKHAQRIREAIGGFSVPGQPRVTVSVGVTMLTSEDETGKDALKRADQALYAAKSAGRNRTYAK